MKVLNLSGGVTCTVVGRLHAARAGLRLRLGARGARLPRLGAASTWPRFAGRPRRRRAWRKLHYIDTYLANKFAFLRFNYSTGDAAGQNMVGRATFAACSWILEHYPDVRRFYLESNFATDKKASQVNVMRTRGKRVTAEATIPRAVLQRAPAGRARDAGVPLRAWPTSARFLSGANNNGSHSPNGITAMFIATGQDVANVAEGSAAIVYTELTPDGDLYISITIPSLIVATHGGGTGLATQRECLEILGCTGRAR